MSTDETVEKLMAEHDEDLRSMAGDNTKGRARNRRKKKRQREARAKLIVPTVPRYRARRRLTKKERKHGAV